MRNLLPPTDKAPSKLFIHRDLSTGHLPGELDPLFALLRLKIDFLYVCLNDIHRLGAQDGRPGAGPQGDPQAPHF